MLTTNSSDPLGSLAGQAAQSANAAMKSTQRAAGEAMDSVAQAVRDGSRQARATAQRASDTGVTYVRAEPVKAVLMAVATGAALLAVFSLLTRSRDRG